MSLSSSLVGTSWASMMSQIQQSNRVHEDLAGVVSDLATAHAATSSVVNNVKEKQALATVAAANPAAAASALSAVLSAMGPASAEAASKAGVEVKEVIPGASAAAAIAAAAAFRSATSAPALAQSQKDMTKAPEASKMAAMANREDDAKTTRSSRDKDAADGTGAATSTSTPSDETEVEAGTLPELPEVDFPSVPDEGATMATIPEIGTGFTKGADVAAVQPAKAETVSATHLRQAV